jgi:signal transduction histidine kinase/ActR/RegA family two-component response regulator
MELEESQSAKIEQLEGIIQRLRTSLLEHERDESLSGFLSRAASLLNSSLDIKKTLDSLAAIAVPTIADWCSVYLTSESGHVEHFAVAHVNPKKVELAREFTRSFPPDFANANGIGAVVKTSQSMCVPIFSEEMMVEGAKSAEHLLMMRELGLKSFIVVPLKGPKRVLGAVVLANSESENRFDENDLRWAQELAIRAALAVENSRLFGEAQAVNRAKDEFLATLSHELRTPLNVILGNSEYLLSTLELEHEDQEALSAIYRNAQLQTQLIADLLDVSSIITGKIRFQTQELSAKELLLQTIENLRPTAEARGILLTAELALSPDRLAADGTRLQQILWNLISNALKFTPPGGRVLVRSSAHDGGRWLLEVEDTGMGIAHENLSSIFERFQQEDSSTTRRHGGLGLGLSIVKSLVELHGGFVYAESAGKGRGARFVVDIPIHHKAEMLERGAVPTAAHEKSSAKVARLDGARILLVEDSADNRALVARFLKRAGAQVVEADSAEAGRAALALARAGEPVDVIVCDIGMPGEDGIAFIQSVRNAELSAANSSTTRHCTPAVALTAYVRAEEKQACIDAGFQVHLGKPVAQADLIGKLVQLLDRV